MSDNIKKSEDIPATKKMLDETRAELKNNIASVRLDVKSVHTKLDTKIDKAVGELRCEMQSLKTELRGEMQSLKTELRGEMQSMSSGIMAEIKNLTAEVRRSLSKSEEQYAQNIYVLDGYKSLQNQINLNQEKNEQEHKEFRAAIQASKGLDN